jgi:hypothetical protein
MAKLTPKDPQFGIPIATRIREELAHSFNKEAANSNITLSRYVAEFIENAVANEELLNELQAELSHEKETAVIKDRQFKGLETQILKERELSKKVAGLFIAEITKGDKKQVTQLIETYNKIMKDAKQHNG